MTDTNTAPTPVLNVSLQQLATAMIRGANLRQGSFYLAVNFQMAVTNMELGDAGPLPTVAVQVAGLALMPAHEGAPPELIVDAATVWGS